MSTDPESAAADGGRRPTPTRGVAAGVLLLCASAFAAPAHAFTAEQAASGARTYARQCARCHGVNGEGKDNVYRGLRAPALIGPDTLPCVPRATQKIRTRRFRTLDDVYAFVSSLMPADQPAILDADEYWNVLAYLLQQRGTPADGTRLDHATARALALHADCAPPPAH